MSGSAFGLRHCAERCAAFARALGGYGERVAAPDEIAPAIQRGIDATLSGRPALIEFITRKETRASRL